MERLHAQRSAAARAEAAAAASARRCGRRSRYAFEDAGLCNSENAARVDMYSRMWMYSYPNAPQVHGG